MSRPIPVFYVSPPPSPAAERRRAETPILFEGKVPRRRPFLLTCEMDMDDMREPTPPLLAERDLADPAWSLPRPVLVSSIKPQVSKG